MEARKINRQIYHEGIAQIENVIQDDKAYLDQFNIEFPEGLNTASTLEICRAIQEGSFEGKLHLMRLCIVGKTVKVTCPNGDIESFRLGNIDDGIDGFDLFKKEPLVLAIHAGLECGILLSKKPELEIISIGPDIFDIHSVYEKVSIESARRSFQYVVDILQQSIHLAD